MNFNKYKLIILVIMLVSIISCKKQKSSVVYLTKNNTKSIYANKINIHKTILANNGIVLLFDTIANKTYANALGLIPANKSDIKKISNLLSSKQFSFRYTLDEIDITGDNTLKLVVANDKNNIFLKASITDENIIPMIQISYLKGVSIDHRKMKTLALESVNKLIDFSMADSGSNCTSGGIGATSCQVGDIYSSCSVSCSGSYYACCNSDSNTCKCIEE